MFEYPTIRDLATFLAKPDSTDESAIAHPPAPLPVVFDEPNESLDEDLDVAVTRRLERLEALMRHG